MLRQIGVGLLVLVALCGAMTPLLLPDPWCLVYAITVDVLGFSYLIGKDIVRG